MNTENNTPQFLIFESHIGSKLTDLHNGITSYHNTRQEARQAMWDIMLTFCRDPREEFIDTLEYWLDGKNLEPAPVVTWANEKLTISFHDKIITYELQTTQQYLSCLQLLHI